MKLQTQEQLKKLLHYDPLTGVFTWLPREGDISFDARLVGKRTGAVWKKRYRRIKVLGAKYPEHRLAWLYVYGVWPSCVDHIDNDPGNNAISNLRDITRKQNLARFCSKRPLGKGVHKYGIKRFYATITKDGIEYKLGIFDTPEEARVAYAVKARELWGEFAE